MEFRRVYTVYVDVLGFGLEDYEMKLNWNRRFVMAIEKCTFSILNKFVLTTKVDENVNESIFFKINPF